MKTDEPSAREIIDALGRREMKAEIGCSKQTLSAAYREDRMPARWYSVVADMCAAENLPCPRSAFNFVESAATADRSEAA